MALFQTKEKIIDVPASPQFQRITNAPGDVTGAVWEYMTVILKDIGHTTEAMNRLNAYGAYGWEVVNASINELAGEMTYTLKRRTR